MAIKKKVQVVLNTVKEEEKTLWQKIKDKFYNSGTIMLHAATVAVGAVVSTVSGIFSYVDWSSPLNMLKQGITFSKEQWLVIGGSTVLLGILGYFTRTSGTKVVENRLLPKAE
jgi:magnesium-transporting ATPase (P-type)